MKEVDFEKLLTNSGFSFGNTSSILETVYHNLIERGFTKEEAVLLIQNVYGVAKMETLQGSYVPL